MKKKKNPNDLTGRNLQAQKKRNLSVKERAKWFEARVSALERFANALSKEFESWNGMPCNYVKPKARK